MNELNPIDDFSDLESQNSPLYESFAWWEKNRLYFNLLVGIVGVLSTLQFSNYFGVDEIIGSLLWGLVANLFYSAGFMLEGMDYYYFKGKFRIKVIRMVFFVVGTLSYCAVSYLFAFSYYAFQPLPWPQN